MKHLREHTFNTISVSPRRLPISVFSAAGRYTTIADRLRIRREACCHNRRIVIWYSALRVKATQERIEP